jgi:hypothetical protein
MGKAPIFAARCVIIRLGGEATACLYYSTRVIVNGCAMSSSRSVKFDYLSFTAFPGISQCLRRNNGTRG